MLLNHSNTIQSIESKATQKKVKLHDDLSQIDSQEEEHDKCAHDVDAEPSTSNPCTDSREKLTKTISFNEKSMSPSDTSLVPGKRKRMGINRS